MNRQLNILMDARMVGHQIHGIARYTIDLVRSLHELNHKVSILYFNHDTPNIIGTKYITEAFKTNSEYLSPKAMLGFLKIPSKIKYDVTHFPSFSVPWNLPERSVVTIHDLIHLHPPRSATKLLYYYGFLKPALVKASKVITVSEWTKGDLNRLLGIDFKKIRVVRNGIDFESFKPNSENPPSVEKPYFICVSNTKKHKNVNMLIKACQHLWQHGHKFNLVLALAGQEIPSSWKVPSLAFKRIILLKGVSDSVLQNYIQNARAIISPSLIEGFDFPVAEALALGTPAIISDGSAHSEFRSNRITYYHPPTNMPQLASLILQKLKTQEEDPLPVEHNIISRLEMAQQTVNVYSEVIKESTP